jgi:hypothetical protein
LLFLVNFLDEAHSSLSLCRWKTIDCEEKDEFFPPHRSHIKAFNDPWQYKKLIESNDLEIYILSNIIYKIAK